jgi:hypothetical protein
MHDQPGPGMPEVRQRGVNFSAFPSVRGGVLLDERDQRVRLLWSTRDRK